jgi:hypothetical protein
VDSPNHSAFVAVAVAAAIVVAFAGVAVPTIVFVLRCTQFDVPP